MKKKIEKEDIEELKSIWMDPGKIFKELKEQEDLSQELYELEVKEENMRISNLCCPLCKSNNKHLHIDYSSNGIYGPGSSSRIINEYYICNECGILFKDLKKKDIQRPSKLFNF
jgi:transposase-like protein